MASAIATPAPVPDGEHSFRTSVDTDGHPVVYVLDPDGEVVGRVGFDTLFGKPLLHIAAKAMFCDDETFDMIDGSLTRDVNLLSNETAPDSRKTPMFYLERGIAPRDRC